MRRERVPEVHVVIALFLFFVSVLILLAVVVGIVAVPVMVARKFVRNGPPSRMAETQYADDARKLVKEIKESLKTCPLDSEQKSQMLRQVRDVPDNVVRALNKLHRLRRIKKIAKRSEDVTNASDVLNDIKLMERQIVVELRRTHETLLSVPVSLMKVDTARGERNLDRMIAELSETNQRLNDLADSYGDLRAKQNLGYQ